MDDGGFSTPFNFPLSTFSEGKFAHQNYVQSNYNSSKFDDYMLNRDCSLYTWNIFYVPFAFLVLLTIFLQMCTV